MVLASVWFLGFGGAAVVHRSALLASCATTVWALDGLVLFYLWGPAASIVVTPAHILVNNPYVRYKIARVTVAGPPVPGFWFARLPLHTGAAIRLAALNLNLPRGYPDRLARHDHRSLAQMMAQVPAVDEPGDPKRNLRPGTIVLAALTASGTIAVTTAILHATNR